MKKVLLISLLLLSLINLYSEEAEELYAKMFNMFINKEESDDYSGLNSFLTLYIPPGGKYEGMGTAFTGMPNNIGFFNANPSVSSRLNLSEVSFFHNQFIEDVDMETIAFTGRYNDMGFGFQGKWMHIGFTAFNQWAETESKGHYSEFVLKNNLSWNILRGFDFSGISIGFNINLAYRSVPDVYSRIDVQNQSSFAAMIDFGILSEFNFLKFYTSRARNLSIGFSIMNFGQEFIDGPDPLPTLASIGLAYSPIEALKISYDLSYQFNIHQNPTFINGKYNQVNYSFYQGEGFHNSVGFSMQVLEIASLHGGFLIKPDSPRITLGTEISFRKNPGEIINQEQDYKDSKNEYILAINYSLDLIPEDFLHRYSIELKLNLGDYQRLEKREQVQSLYVKGLQLYADDKITEAIELWDACLKIDDKFDPAIRMKELANQSLELQNKIKERETVE